MSYFGLARSRRETSLSIAARMRSRRSSSSASTASIRALAPRGRVRFTFSCHSFARPMRRGVACTCKSVKAVSFRVRDSLTYHVRGICSIAYTIGAKTMWTMTEDDKANARGGVDCPAAREAQARMAANAAKRRAKAAKVQARAAAERTAWAAAQ